MQTKIQHSRIATYLFGNYSLAPLWLILRIYIGYEWVLAASEKMFSPVWIGSQTGVALTGFLKGSLAKTTGAHPDVSGWYAYFIQNFALNHTVLFSYLVTYGELAVGVALIFGVLVGVSSFFGMVMNFNFLFAGTASINPIMTLIEIFLLLAWRTAGYYGLDRYVLPRLFKQRK